MQVYAIYLYIFLEIYFVNLNTMKKTMLEMTSRQNY